MVVSAFGQEAALWWDRLRRVESRRRGSWRWRCAFRIDGFETYRAYAAKVIVDERTLNKHVVVFNEMWTPLQIVEHWEKISGEKLERTYVSETELKKTIDSCGDGMGILTLMVKIPAQYLVSWEYAKYLGYVTSKELCPDFEPRKFDDYAEEVLDGKAAQIYEELKVKFAEMVMKK
ncbi:hypothetical protein AC578_9610 [Pseudocercospora eumusae]|uniref:NmrA-like domain-containing protein n=1 Tax=Pseudocercospora eumusae TaxID=321146 RepID=A0A139H4Q9_9PEZI|nr:hypothetical protein AC578_9610 [Pseudocercospora eumusae]